MHVFKKEMKNTSLFLSFKKTHMNIEFKEILINFTATTSENKSQGVQIINKISTNINQKILPLGGKINLLGNFF